jgi:8-oxo-dGTP diphosphatase
MGPKTVTAAIAIRDKHVLLAKRAIGQSLAGYWEFPGGKLEPGETLQKCLERELLEELNIKTRAGAVFHENLYEYNNGAINLVGLETELLSDNFVLLVHDEIQWVKIVNLLDYKLAPADIPIAKKVKEHYGI